MTPRQEKAKRIAEQIVHTAKVVTEQLIVAYPKKRAFRKIDRTPGKRIAKNRAKIMAPMAAVLGATQVMLIQSQPVPKYPPGSKFPSGGIINEKP